MIDTVFFDWGGVIADDPGDDFLKNILQTYGASTAQIQEISRKHMYKFMRGQLSEQQYRHILERDYGLIIPASTESMFAAWQGLTTNPEVMEIVEHIKRSQKTVAVLSNIILPTYKILKNSRAYEPFDVVITSCVEGFAKPETEIYQIALDKANTIAERSLFIDDKMHNLKTASALGFKTILAKNPAQFIDEIRGMLSIDSSRV